MNLRPAPEALKLQFDPGNGRPNHLFRTVYAKPWKERLPKRLYMHDPLSIASSPPPTAAPTVLSMSRMHGISGQIGSTFVALQGLVLDERVLRARSIKIHSDLRQATSRFPYQTSAVTTPPSYWQHFG